MLYVLELVAALLCKFKDFLCLIRMYEWSFKECFFRFDLISLILMDLSALFFEV